MAQQLIQDTQLRLVFEAGVDSNGKMKYKNKNYNNVKTDATTEDLLAVAEALINLQTFISDGVERNDSHIVIE
jgi:hypothetical protein